MTGGAPSIVRRVSFSPPASSVRGLRHSRIWVYAGIAVVGTAASVQIVDSGAGIPKPLVLLLALAGGALMFSIRTERLLLGWLFLAPILQESAGTHRIGSLLGLALYTAPPAIFALKTILNRGIRPAARWFDAAPALYVGYVFGSLAIASDALGTNFVGTSRAFFQTVALGALIYYVIVFWPGRAVAAAHVCGVVLAAAGLQAAMSIVEFGTGWNLWNDLGWRTAGDIQRSVGTLANPALLGAFIGVGLVVALGVVCWDGPRQLRRLAWLVLVVGPPGLLFTFTRGPILATVLVACSVLLLSARTRLIGVGVVAVVGIAIFAAWPSITSSGLYQKRVVQQQNVQIRVVLQEVSIKLAEEKPLFGWGYGSFDRVKYDVKINNPGVPLAVVLHDTSHDTFLTILVEYGSLGLILFLLPFVVICWPALRLVRTGVPERWLYVVATAAIGVVVLSATTFDLRFFSLIPMLPWLFLGLARRAQADAVGSPAS